MSKVQKYNRVTFKQRQIMLRFMVNHPDICRGRMFSTEAISRRWALIGELTESLNAIPDGARKPPDKWLRCWRDWRSDVKAKNMNIKKARSRSGGPTPAPLSKLEEQLLHFCGVETVEEMQGVPDEAQGISDPLEIATQQDESIGDVSSYEVIGEDLEEDFNIEGAEIQDTSDFNPPSEEGPSMSDTKPGLGTSDPLQRHSVALERVADSIDGLSLAILQGCDGIANALTLIARSIQTQNGNRP